MILLLAADTGSRSCSSTSILQTRYKVESGISTGAKVIMTGRCVTAATGRIRGPTFLVAHIIVSMVLLLALVTRLRAQPFKAQLFHERSSEETLRVRIPLSRYEYKYHFIVDWGDGSDIESHISYVDFHRPLKHTYAAATAGAAHGQGLCGCGVGSCGGSH